MQSPIVSSPSTFATKSNYRGLSSGVGRRSAVRSTRTPLRSRSSPAKRPTYTPTEAVLPLDLKASVPSAPTPYLSSKLAKYGQLQNSRPNFSQNTDVPMYSRSVRTTFSPFRSITPLRADSPSDFGSESPYRSSSPVSFERRASIGRRRIRPPRVVSSKRRVGNYYNRLLSKRGVSGKVGKYWPYIDVEDIADENISDLVSDCEYQDDTGSSYNYAVKLGDMGNYDTYDVTSEPLGLVYDTYSNELDYDIPDDYVPFKPRTRVVSPERDYSELSVLPYLPARDCTKTSVADDISFNAVVAQSAARARRALENVNWDSYDSAGLVLSVEGEYIPPQDETPVGFRYISRPIMLKVPALQRVRATDSDNSFTRYMTDLRKFRDEIRIRLEEGYRSLCNDSKSYYTPPSQPISSAISSSYTPYVSKYRPKHTYHSSLLEDEGNKYGHSLEFYPTTTSSYRRTPSAITSTRSVLHRDDTLPQARSGAISIFDSKSGSDSKIGTLARIEIKVQVYHNP